MAPILEVKNLHVCFSTNSGEIKAVRGVNFYVNEGETLAIVGESGSGKSVTSKAIMRLIPTPPGQIVNGEIYYKKKDLLKVKEKEMQAVRGVEISMIFQDPFTSINPTMTIGTQIAEGIMKQKKVSKAEAMLRVIELLRLVGIPNPEVRMKQYPHQFSGGMRQRIVIAIALACNPKVLIADEPTTALDATIQAQILDLMKEIQVKIKTAIIFITHDLGVVANIADRVAVMYAGKIVETGSVDEIFYKPKHPYTWGLLSSMPRLTTKKGELYNIPGTPPDLVSSSQGCLFAPRCSYKMAVCLHHMPKVAKFSSTGYSVCWLQDERAPKVVPLIDASGGLF
ncbi:ABC transporter ATP-binding protein [Schinkia sp. CFF1]